MDGFLFHLIIILLFLFLVVDLEVAKLVGVLRGSHDAEPIAQVVLLQVLKIADTVGKLKQQSQSKATKAVRRYTKQLIR